jgi:DNA-binding NtrC family response regulator
MQTPSTNLMMLQKNAPETVLVVDDEENIRKIIRLALEKKGYIVIESSDAQEALAVAESYPGVIGVVLVDIVLPVISGRQLSKLLTARYPGMKVIYMTGYTEDIIQMHDDSHPLLQKPFTMSELVQKVKAVLSA